jgi:hypothetical protein
MSDRVWQQGPGVWPLFSCKARKKKSILAVRAVCPPATTHVEVHWGRRGWIIQVVHRTL